jgi:hypothetical protein
MPNKLEILLRKAGRDLADHQVCRFFKVPEEMTATPCDFFGYTSCGRAILIEAKMVQRTSLPIGNIPGLSKHQWNELRDANKAGAHALIVWAQGDRSACIPMDMAIQMTMDRKSIPWKGIPKHLHRPLRGADAHLHLLEPWISITPDTQSIPSHQSS